MLKELRIAPEQFGEYYSIFGADHEPRACDINGGECDTFADRVKAHFPEVEFRDSPLGHRWMYWNGRHYDAEVPNGVEDPAKLPFFLRIGAFE